MYIIYIKYVYKVVCIILNKYILLDGTIFHGSCLGFNHDTDTCFQFHIQSGTVPD